MLFVDERSNCSVYAVVLEITKVLAVKKTQECIVIGDLGGRNGECEMFIAGNKALYRAKSASKAVAGLLVAEGFLEAFFISKVCTPFRVITSNFGFCKGHKSQSQCEWGFEQERYAKHL